MARALAGHGRVARVVVAETAGSVPREVGASMLVWPGGQSGTIGGGALEFEAAKTALDVLETGADRVDRRPLGPGLGQCCGGAVTLLTEVWDATRLERVTDDVVARGPGEMPLAVRRVLNAARAEGRAPAPALVAGWMVEPVTKPVRELWIWGAGHVGRALVAVLSPLPDLSITWVDTAAERFPATVPEGVTQLVAANPADLVAHAPNEAEHLILTFSHALDLELCHRLLRHGFRFAGLIGSATKWARFRSRLRQLGHADAQIDRICCPIGQPELGKHPQAIAVGVAAGLLMPDNKSVTVKDTG
ncbi:molybdenum cofactor sulfurylase [Tranquillimonas alkanivorans]|uniref:Molybdenum cofactor sulfurylase n=2 Tax=Tranquillimonas alkanivorans TaxID=441119 RepID=A0A1I5U178_9RHOB|nr:molybdenum cofactor sulfurylase [Tranquillimonas alkanivorans]